MILKSDGQIDRMRRCFSSIVPHIDKFYATITTSDGKPDLKCNAYIACKEVNADISWFKWIDDFTAARQFNFERVHPDYEYIFWCDDDDIVIGANCLRELAAVGIKQDIGAFFCTYYYLLSPPGFEHFEKTGEVIEKQVMIKHLRERLVRKNKYHWVGRLHETLIETVPTRKVDIKQFAVVHTASAEDMQDALVRNIRILEKALAAETKKGKRDPRTVYYLGKAYFDLHTEKERKLSMALLNEYLDGPNPSGWEEERAQAWEYLSTIYMEENDNQKALKCAINALIESPKFPSSWLQVATVYARSALWEKAVFWAEVAAKIPEPQTTLITNTRGGTIQYLEILFGEAVEKNDVDRAYEIADKMYKLAPDNPHTKERFDMMTGFRKQKEVLASVRNVANYLSERGERGKLLPLIASVPDDLSGNEMIEKMRQSVSPPKTWGDKSVAFFCGPSFEKWSPKNWNEWKNLAGSEEATIRLCRQLAKLGWDVTVFGNPLEDEGTYEGVRYVQYYKLNPQDTFNVLVIWRQPGLLSTNWNTKKTYLWLHDIPNPLDFTKERVEKVNKIIPLSRWHRDCLPELPDDKFMISANGIDLDQLEDKNVKRDPYRCIWTSSYDRGIEHLLKIWPDVKKEVPEANLHIFYGWGLFDKLYYNNPERKMWKERMVELMKQPGVTEYGKIGQEQIIDEYMKSGIWAYPTHFGEISCISAMKAQACGAIPVTIDYAAVHETVQYGVKIKGDIYDQETKEAYKKALIKALKDHKWQEEERVKMVPWARKKFDWSLVSKQWQKEFLK